MGLTPSRAIEDASRALRDAQRLKPQGYVGVLARIVREAEAAPVSRTDRWGENIHVVLGDKRSSASSMFVARAARAEFALDRP